MSVNMGKLAPVLRFTEYVSAEGNATNAGRKHRGVVVNAPETEVELRKRLNNLQSSELTTSEAELVLRVLRAHFLFSRMTPTQLMQIVKSVEKVLASA